MNAKEIWDKLKVTYEGTSQVNESKITLLSHHYEIFKMQPGENMTAMFDKFTNIANKYSDDESEEINAKSNLCLMANDYSSDDEVTSNSNFNIFYEELENEHDDLILEYEKLLNTCMKLKQNLIELKDEFTNVQKEKDALSVKLGKANTDYSALMEKHENRAKELDIALGEILSLKKRLEKSSKMTLNSNVQRRKSSFKRKFNGYCYCCGKKGYLSYNYYHNDRVPKTSMVWVPKGSHVLTNPQGPIKVWVPKCK
ncbi:hypothetical protein REPUB_Repub05bG0070600 [Reevesia pubescens]